MDSRLQRLLQEVPKEKERLDATDMRVFTVLTAKLNFDNFTPIVQDELVEEFTEGGMPKNKHQISRSMTALENCGVILPGPKAGHRQSWRFNSEFRHRAIQSPAEAISIKPDSPRIRNRTGRIPSGKE